MSDKKFAVILSLLGVMTLCVVVGLMVMVLRDTSNHRSVTGRPGSSGGAKLSLGLNK